VGASEPWAQLCAALARPAPASTDHDLNPAWRPEPRPLCAAAVLVALQEGRGGLAVVLTKRASGLRNHPGQIAFPGGKVDDRDAGPIAAALREAKEEIGLPPALVEPLGALPQHETVTGFAMTPVVARIAGAFDPRPDPGEVEEVFTVPLAHVADPARYRVERRMWRGQWRNYYAVPWGPYYIWGATARILRGLADRLAA
jgi:8-oxo-dGTP pyrophosphatase MutT (NUDIX family)